MRKSAADPMKSWDAGECITATAADDWADDIDAALEGWEKREPLRDQQELRAAIVTALASSSEERVYVPAILDALETLLYGERG